MTTLPPDFDNECLVTDLVQDLSSGLEIPYLLSGTSQTFDEDEDFKFTDSLYEQEKNDYWWLDSDASLNQDSIKHEFETMSEMDDLQSYLVKNDIFATQFKTDSSGNGSGSDCSSTELWTVKNELDTPPVTPPEERISPDNILFLSSNELKFIPVSKQGSRKNRQVFSSSNRTVRIQPKPKVATFDIIGDSKQCNGQTIVCNVFKDVQSPFVDVKRNSINGSTNEVMRTILSRKDLEMLQAKRKQERMIRNRESAYLSRKRKKEYVAQLEKQVQELVNENNQLRQENLNLKQKLMKYEDMDRFTPGTKSRNMFTDSPRKTTALLALMLTVCLNIGSFSSFLNDRTGRQTEGNFLESDNPVPFHMQNVRHSRSLLWSDPQFDDLNSSFANFSKTSCPINQTESIRLESELRRWIRGDEDFSNPKRQNISKIDEYFYTNDRAVKNSSKSKRKNRIRRTHSAPDVGVDVFRMNSSHFFNFDTFFEAIHRRDDTFYLVSFSADHLLLPALAHNKTSRPKMSLMLPAFLSNATMGVSSDQVEMMQIDCEVTNTQLLSVNENDIPSHMRPYTNSTSKQKAPSSIDSSQFPDYLVNLTAKTNPSENASSAGFEGGKERKRTGKKFKESEDDGKPSKFKSGYHVTDTEYNGNGEESKGNEYKQSRGYFFPDSKSGSDSNESSSESYSVAAEEVLHYIDPNPKNILKTLVVPPAVTQAKALTYTGKKPYLKTIKSTMKFLFP